MKMALIGGGSLRTPYFVESLAKYAPKLGIDELWIMDTDGEKLRLFAGLSAYLAKKDGSQVDIRLTEDPVEAIRDAKYVVTTIRVGQDGARILDERIALSHGVIGQETTGAGGFSYALRTIPVMLHYMELVKQYAAKDAIVFNFTNPSGLVTQAMVDHGYRNIIGICDNATGMKIELAKALELHASSFFVRVYGLNHLSWGDQVLVDGEDILPALMEQEAFIQNFHEFSYFDRDLVRNIKSIPNGYLYYFYHRERALANMLKSEKTRGEAIDAINRPMLEAMRKMKPDDFEAINACFREAMGRREGSYMSMELGGQKEALGRINVGKLGIDKLRHREATTELYEGYAGIVFNYIQAQHTGEPIDIALNVPNDGAVAGMAEDDVVEVSCTVDSQGAKPVSIPDPAPDNLILMQTIKRYEKLTVAASDAKSKELAKEALMLHPLVSSWSLAKELVDDYLVAHKQYLEGWR